MTRTDRVKTVLAGGVPDRIPVMAHNFMMAVEETGITQKESRDDPESMVRTMIATTGCALGPNTKGENLAAFVKACHEHGGD